jgi:hypothetical protein
MLRPPFPAVALGLFLLTALQAEATVIDSFESGPLSLTRSTGGLESTIVSPNAGHCIAADRTVHLYYHDEAAGSFSATVTPQQGSDDEITYVFPDDANSYSFVSLVYTGGPWDLTQAGTHNQISVRATGGGPQTTLQVRLEDDTGSFEWMSATLSATGTYQFPLAWYTADGVDVTSIVEVLVKTLGGTGVVAGIRDISTSSGTGVTLIYDAYSPSSFTYLCLARGGAQAVGWDWGIGWPSQPTLAGPELQVTGISGSNCQGVAFQAFDSGGGEGEFGEMGMVQVDWLAPTFDGAMFEMQLVTDPDLTYETVLLGTPEVALEETAFTIRHEIRLGGAPGVPTGVASQELIVAAAPGQELYFDWAEALPLGGPAAGYSLSFGITGAAVDPAEPLLEIHTTGAYSDDAGATEAAIGAAGDRDAPGLTAHPSVTRTGTRFVLSGEAIESSPVEVYDVAGRRIRTLEARSGEVDWDGADDRGARVPAGVYFGRVPDRSGAARVVLLR